MLLSNQWADSTCNRYRVLSGLFRRAIKNVKTQPNPVRETAHRRENNARVRYLTSEEESDLMATIREPARETEVLSSLHTGMRRNEQYHTAQSTDGG